MFKYRKQRYFMKRDNKKDFTYILQGFKPYLEGKKTTNILFGVF